jgi:hypothetical protein
MSDHGYVADRSPTTAGALITMARQDGHLAQRELAARAGVTQSEVAGSRAARESRRSQHCRRSWPAPGSNCGSASPRWMTTTRPLSVARPNAATESRCSRRTGTVAMWPSSRPTSGRGEAPGTCRGGHPGRAQPPQRRLRRGRRLRRHRTGSAGRCHLRHRPNPQEGCREPSAKAHAMASWDAACRNGSSIRPAIRGRSSQA